MGGLYCCEGNGWKGEALYCRGGSERNAPKGASLLSKPVGGRPRFLAYPLLGAMEPPTTTCFKMQEEANINVTKTGCEKYNGTEKQTKRKAARRRRRVTAQSPLCVDKTSPCLRPSDIKSLKQTVAPAPDKKR